MSDIDVRLGELLAQIGVTTAHTPPQRVDPLDHLDSMQVLDLLLSSEREFEVSLPAHALLTAGAMETFGSLRDFIAQAISGDTK